MCKKRKAPLVAEPSQRLIPLDLSGAGGAGDGGDAGGNVSVLSRRLHSSLHPLP
jgi:hypothetical protein